MRMKMVCDDRTLREISNEFLALKKAQKIRDRTLSDYRKYIDKFLDQSENVLDVEILKAEILDFFAEIPKTSPARFNHPYQYLHALFEWCAKQDYIALVQRLLQHSFASTTQRYIGIEPQKIETAIQNHAQLL